MAPHITFRDSICMPCNAPPEEPTITLVLSSSQNRFIDIRLLKTLPGLIPAAAENAGMLPFSHLDWAFAGTSSSRTFKSAKGDSEQLKSTWKHWIDSRYLDAENVKDEGFMYPQPDGRTMERGHAIDPRTGFLERYSEMWRDVQIYGIEEKVLASTRFPKCVVLTMESTRQTEGGEERARGMVIRLGQFCQGIVRVGEALALERWEWKEGQGGGWRRAFRMGDLFLPCGLAMEFRGRDARPMDLEKLRPDSKVTYDWLTWSVAEMEG